MGNKPLVIFGTSNTLSDVFDLTMGLGYDIKKIVINTEEIIRPRVRKLSSRLQDLPFLPEIQALAEFSPKPDESYFIAPSSPEKSKLVESIHLQYDIAFCSLIHPTAYIGLACRIGEGVFIGANTAVGASVSIGYCSYINRGIAIGHDTQVGNYCRLNPGCNIAGQTIIGDRTVVGLGANIAEELVIGKNVTVAAGAVVLRDVPDNVMVAGVPAEIKKKN